MFFRNATLILLACGCVLSQPSVPRLPHQADPHWPRLPAGWTFQETPGVAVDAREHVYVFHRGEHSIIEFDPAGNMVRSWGDNVFLRPHAVRFDPQGNLWAVDDLGHIVVKMDSAGRVRMVLGRKGNKGETPELFDRPTDVAFAPDGSIYVSDGYGNSRVVKFSKDGRYITAWGKKGAGPGEFNLPHSVAVDKQGRVYVGDRENRRLQIFDADGKFLREWKHAGSPWGLSLTPDQLLYLCDGYNNRILKLDLEGKILGSLGRHGKLPGELDFAHQLAVSPGGAIYVAEIKNWRVQKFAVQ